MRLNKLQIPQEPQRSHELKVMREHYTAKFKNGVVAGEKAQVICEQRRRWTAGVAKIAAPGVAAVTAIAGVATLSDAFGSDGKTVAAWFAIAAAAMTAVAAWATTRAADIAAETQRWMTFTEACRDYGNVHVTCDEWLRETEGSPPGNITCTQCSHT